LFYSKPLHLIAVACYVLKFPWASDRPSSGQDSEIEVNFGDADVFNE